MSSEDLKALIKKASTQAVKAKMDLHDLSEELPLGWEKIEEVARAATEAYRNLTDLKAALADSAPLIQD